MSGDHPSPNGHKPIPAIKSVASRSTIKYTVLSAGLAERHKEEQKVQTIETVIEKEVNILKWWQKALMWMGAVSTLIFLSSLAFKLLHQ